MNSSPRTSRAPSPPSRRSATGKWSSPGLYRRSAKEVRAILDRHGLQAPAGHVGIPQITDTIDQTIADAKTLGHEYVVVPWIPEESRTRDGYRQMAEILNRAAEKLHRVGLTLGYHNHWFEFDPISDGDSGGPSCGYDVLLRHTDPKLVVMELDLYWIRKGGRDALQYFHDFKGRFRLVHVKDMAADGSMVDVGRGVIGWADLLTAAKKAGVQHFLAEHDDAKEPLAFARTSFDTCALSLSRSRRAAEPPSRRAAEYAPLQPDPLSARFLRSAS